MVAATAFRMPEGDQGNAAVRLDKVTQDADGAFALNDEQWSGLELTAVRQVAFRDERTTDGQDRHRRRHHPAVFFPCSGRVTHLTAKPDDYAGRGAPLFAIEAGEFVQGRNDLVTAAASVEKAKSQLELAHASERRQRELRAIRGRAFKDLEQTQSDLVSDKRALAQAR